jgi:deoxyribonuclease (pyrimidine dimer)
MTRINVGIKPWELCDQHLIAEYKELPRAYGKRYKARPPKHFCLGTGHVVWCAQHQQSLWTRHQQLVEEMTRRGFATNIELSMPGDDMIFALGWMCWQTSEATRARYILQERILDRLDNMRGTPRWTNRLRPEWVVRRRTPW